VQAVTRAARGSGDGANNVLPAAIIGLVGRSWRSCAGGSEAKPLPQEQELYVLVHHA
jgi:hypothetical protein